MFELENDTLRAAIAGKGAELKSLFHKDHGLEYMWGADPAYWAKTSPVLFPIVGALKEDTYFYKERAYSLPRHGFARNADFKLTEHHKNTLTFSLESNAETLSIYPFTFTFSITYTLKSNELATSYRVQNTGNETMLFSLGGHPAFKLPLVNGTAYDDYKLIFEKPETVGRWPISKDGLIGTPPQLLLDGSQVINLKKELFSNDALVLKDLQSRSVRLASDKTTHGLHFDFAGFPYLGLWAAPGADFVCIEPWCGIADPVDTDQQLEHKEGILRLLPSGTFEVQWNVKVY